MWLVGVVIRRYIDILIIIINFPYSTCIRSFFGSSILTSLFIFKMFFRSLLYRVNRYPVQYFSGIKEAKGELQRDYSVCTIRYLCNPYVSDVGDPEVTCYQASKCLQSFVVQFSILSQKYNSAIFSTIWSMSMKHAYINNRNMTITDIAPQVWKPAFKKCQDLLEKLKDTSITLSDVDSHFEKYKTVPKRLEGDLECLFNGINKCLGVSEDFAWIDSVVAQIHKYWRLCNYRQAAILFLELRDALTLTKGDFRDVERISKEVMFSTYVCI